jgi:hypothetical protein
MPRCCAPRAAALALLATLCALCLSRCVVGEAAEPAARLSAGLLGGASLDLSSSAAQPGHAAARFAAGAVRAAATRVLRAAAGGDSALGASLAETLTAAAVPPGARLHAVHADASELDFLRNWARACRVQRIPNLALFALDADAAAAGERLGLMTFECAHACEAPEQLRRAGGTPGPAC